MMSGHVVLGATGGSGGAVVRELVRQGKSVRAVSRSGGTFGPEVESVQGDVRDMNDARRVCGGAAVVYNCANIPYQDWLSTFPAIVRGSLEGAASANARLVFCDNLYMYGPPDGPMTETTPRNATGKKGRLRIALEHTLLDAHRSGKVQVAIGRGSDFYGPGANSVTKDFVFGNVLKGKRSLWPMTLDAPHSMNYAEDFARNLVTLGTRDEALGEVWHLPAGEPLTGREFIRLASLAAGKKPKPGVLSALMIRVGGLFNPLVREFAEVGYQFARPFVMDAHKFERAFGGSVTPHEEAVGRTLEFYRTHR